MRAISFFGIAAAFLIMIAGCGGKPAPEKLAIKGNNTVCILSGEKRFKNEVITKVSRSLEANGYTVVRDENGNSKYYAASDYGAVIYIAEYWAWHTPRHAIRYFNRNGKARNIIFLITSGDPDVKIQKPFDAVTSASSIKNVDKASEEIIIRVNRIME